MQKLSIHTGTPSRLHNESINRPLTSLLDVSFLPEPREHRKVQVVHEQNRAIVARTQAKTADAVLGIRTEQSIVNMVGRTVSYLRIRQDLACFEVANMQSVRLMVTTVSIGDACSLLLLTGLCLQLKTQMEDHWENHEDDQETAVNGLRLAEGQCLFMGIKLVEQPFRKAAKPTHTLQDVDDGGFPAIDIVSCGFIRDDRVLSQCLKVYWFTFDRGDRDCILELERMTSKEVLNKPEFWVKQQFAVVSYPLGSGSLHAS